MIRKPILAAAATAVVCCAVACTAQGSDSTGGNTSAPTSFAGFPGMPGAFGEVASVSGTTFTVTSTMTAEVSVTYTDTTEITDQVAASADALDVGACVQVTADGDSDPVVATTVILSEPVDGTCGAAAGPGGRPPGGGTPPSGMPSGMPSAGRGGLGGTMGEVTAMADGGFTVTAAAPGAGQEVQVSTSTGTTWLTTAAADPDAIVAGRCVMATGETDDSGAVTATSIAMSDPVDGACGAGRP